MNIYLLDLQGIRQNFLLKNVLKKIFNCSTDITIVSGEKPLRNFNKQGKCKNKWAAFAHRGKVTPS